MKTEHTHCSTVVYTLYKKLANKKHIETTLEEFNFVTRHYDCCGRRYKLEKRVK